MPTAHKLETGDVMTKNAEARARYYYREEARPLEWNTNNPHGRILFLREQELVDLSKTQRSRLVQGERRNYDDKRSKLGIALQRDQVLIL
jgi:hypothetical protein